MMTRRTFLAGTAATAAAVTASPAAPAHATNYPIEATPFGSVEMQLKPWLGLARSLPEEHDYMAEVEGAIPADLRGVLFRNGPGLFERDGKRKQCILDGDGMIQAYRVGDDGVQYQNRYTQTEKYVEEQKAGKYKYATWTTQAPGGRLSNLFARRMSNQAGVSTTVKNGTLYAFDESSEPHALLPDSLETIGLSSMGIDPGTTVYSAHSKTDGKTGEWLHFGLAYAREVTVQLTTFKADGTVKSRRSVPLPSYSYMHDWFVTEHYVILNVHPADIAIFDFLLGSASLVGSMEWNPDRGNRLLIIPREGDATPTELEAPARWMWHSLNAYERGDEIIADYVGYDDPSHFIGDNAPLFAIMSGSPGQNAPQGLLRRYTINVKTKSVTDEVLGDGNFEFPIVNPAHMCYEHRYGYVTAGRGDGFWADGIARVDYATADDHVFHYGEGIFCTEPIFARKPGAVYDAQSEAEPGWVLTQGFNGKTQRSFLAIFDAEHIGDGPVATVHHTHHIPLSFHGYWHAESQGGEA